MCERVSTEQQVTPTPPPTASPSVPPAPSPSRRGRSRFPGTASRHGSGHSPRSPLYSNRPARRSGCSSPARRCRADAFAHAGLRRGKDAMAGGDETVGHAHPAPAAMPGAVHEDIGALSHLRPSLEPLTRLRYAKSTSPLRGEVRKDCQSSLMFRRLIVGAMASAVLRMAAVTSSGDIGVGSKPTLRKRCFSVGSAITLRSSPLR